MILKINNKGRKHRQIQIKMKKKKEGKCLQSAYDEASASDEASVFVSGRH